MCVELKIKAKHLAVEPGIIRVEENKLKKRLRSGKSLDTDLVHKLNGLVLHRRNDVRNEARATQLAIAFLKGKPYKAIERSRRQEYEWKFTCLIIPRVVAMVGKYGTPEQRRATKEALTASIKEWLNS